MKHYLKYVFCRFILFGIFFTFTTGELTAQVLWEKDLGNPVFIPGEPGEWDDAGVCYPVVIHDGTQFIMYYSGFPDISPVGEIGRATSPDGINWTREQDNNPIILRGLSGEWDDASVISGPVLFDGSEYKMWYGGYDGSQYRIGLATSQDGIVWTKYSEENPVLDVGDPGQWDDRNVWTLCVIFDGSIYKIWYCGGDQATRIYRVGYATSPDGIIWTKYDDPATTNPPYAESDTVLDVGDPGEWDDEDIYNCYVLYRNQIYEMWYEAYDGSTYCIGYARSSDGITWDRYAENPVLSPEHAWEGSHVGLGSVLFHDSVYKMWYYGQPDSVYIGYATAPDSIPPTGLYDELSVEYPKKFFLLQNYPNPFNPTTTIEFELPKTSDVMLKIFNIIGREVATLVSDRLTAGSYMYEWDASNIASGVYLYRLEAGEYVVTRKMVLMR